MLRRYASRGEIEADRDRKHSWAADFPSHRYSHELLLLRIWELRRNATASDAAYVALAGALDAPLLTCDRALADVPGVTAAIEVIA